MTKRLLLAALAMMAISAHADIYRCVAADGSTTFSQTPCSDTAERISVQASSATAGPTDCGSAGNCETGNVGKNTCEMLPEANAVLEGGCSEAHSAPKAEQKFNVLGARGNQDQERAQAAADLRKKQSEKMRADLEKQRRIQQCRQNIQTQISQIEARIFAGADPNGQRRELKRLRKKLQQCR